MARFCPLFSSSSGNSVYIGSASGGILIDAGVSAKQCQQALWDIGVDASGIAAIFVTHEHSDHIRGLRVFASRHHTPVYGSAGTLRALEAENHLSTAYEAGLIPECGIEICEMLVKPFHTSHDSNESLGYTVTMPDNKCIAVATDLGVVTRETMDAIYGCDLVMLESNHDIRMLQNGAYPYFLKRRILSDRGHLSNDGCAGTAVELLRGRTSRIVLAHLSKENNHPQLAFESTKAALTGAGAKLGTDYLLSVAGTDCGVVGF